MPILELPPNPAPLPPSETSPTQVKVRTGRYGVLEEHELIYLLDSLDDERSQARFRESVYISLFIWIAVAWFIFYGPRVIFHTPQVMSVSDALKQHDKELTYLDMPKRVSPQLPAPRPTIDRKTMEQLQAMRKAAPSPLPPAPQPQQPAPQVAAQQPQQSQLPPPPPLPRVQTPQLPQQAIPEAPRPAPTKPNFSPQPTAGTAIQQATQGATRNRSLGGGDYGLGPTVRQGMNTGVQVLSDTQGVNFDPYLRQIMREIYNAWIPLIPEEARPPLNKQGVTQLRFSILPNGQIGTMTLEGSTGDEALNRAAWGSITGVGQFPPLPSEFHGPNLELRIHYLVNKTQE